MASSFRSESEGGDLVLAGQLEGEEQTPKAKPGMCCCFISVVP